MKKPLKKTTPVYKRLAGLSALLSAFVLVAWRWPGVGLGLIIAFGLVVLALAVVSFYLLQVARMNEYNRKNRVKRPVQTKERAAR